jgi:hypothetical protein
MKTSLNQKAGNYSLALIFLIVPLYVTSQSSIDINLGKGYVATYTPPPGWTKGQGNCWYSGGAAYICVETKGKYGRSADQILKESLEGLTPIKCDDKLNENEHLRTVWKECTVSVGPRTELRLWAVTDYKMARDAIEISFHLQPGYPSLREAGVKSLENIKVNFSPPPGN